MLRVPKDTSTNYFDVWPAPAKQKDKRHVPLRNLDEPTYSANHRLETSSPPLPSSSAGLNADQPAMDRVSSLKTAVKPKLQQTLEALVSTGLAHVSLTFPEFDNPKDIPREVQQADCAPVVGEDEVFFREDEYTSSLAQEAFSRRADAFAASRLDVFRQAADVMCSNFKTYAPVLRWIIFEYRRFLHFGMELQREERLKLYTERQALHTETGRLRDTLSDLQSENADLKTLVCELEETIESMRAAHESAQRERDGAVKASEEAARMVEAQDNEKATLAKYILKLEKDLAKVREDAKEPARAMLALRQQMIVKEELVKKLGELNERTLNDNSALRREVALLQRARANMESAPRSVRKLESELQAALKTERQLNDSIMKLTAECAAAEKEKELALEALKSQSRYDEKTGVMLTPRPRVTATCLSDSSSTTVRMMEAAARIETLVREVEVCQKTIGVLTSYRELKEDDLKKHIKNESLGLMLPDARFTRKFLVGRGTDNSVPIFLRAVGRVKNQRYTLAQAQAIIRSFRSNLSTTFEVDPESMQSMGCSERLHLYLLAKYGTEGAGEVAYSLYHALQVYRHDPECGFFLKIVDGELDEEVWYTHARMVDDMKQALLEKLKHIREPPLSKMQTYSVLSKFFTLFKEEDVGRLFTALNKDHQGEGVDVYAVFRDPLRAPSNLVKTIFAVLAVDRERYIQSLEAAILDDSEVAAALVTPKVFVKALQRADPNCPADKIEATVNQLFQCEVTHTKTEGLSLGDQYSKEDPNGDVAVEINEFLRRLHYSNLRRYTAESAIEASGNAKAKKQDPAVETAEKLLAYDQFQVDATQEPPSIAPSASFIQRRKEQT